MHTSAVSACSHGVINTCDFTFGYCYKWLLMSMNLFFCGSYIFISIDHIFFKISFLYRELNTKCFTNELHPSPIMFSFILRQVLPKLLKMSGVLELKACHFKACFITSMEKFLSCCFNCFVKPSVEY